MGTEPRFAPPKRLVVKLGSSTLTRDGALDTDRMQQVADSLATLAADGCEVVVVSSGAVAAGMGQMRLSARPTQLADLQAAAAVGQSLLVRAWSETFAPHDRTVAQLLLTSTDFVRRSSYLSLRTTLENLLNRGIVPIINENDAVATDELAYGDNDHLAALVASALKADLLVLLTDVEGLLTAPPSETSSELISEVVDVAAIDPQSVSGSGSHVGSGGMRTKIEAARIATASGCNVVVAHGAAEDIVRAAATGGSVGTWFHPQTSAPDARKMWIGWALTPTGTLHIDGGAVAALRRGGTSLLGVGVTDAQGDFVRGDAIDLRAPDGTLVARGLVTVGVKDLQTTESRQSAGTVVHVDNLCLR